MAAMMDELTGALVEIWDRLELKLAAWLCGAAAGCDHPAVAAASHC